MSDEESIEPTEDAAEAANPAEENGTTEATPETNGVDAEPETTFAGRGETEEAKALTFRLDVFEGPLDLLLYLIKKEEVDIYDIPITRITEQYMEVLKLMQILDLNIAGEFIVMASTLTLIKSRMLLPVEERPDEEEDENDPRFDLVRQLVEYRKFKDAANHLEQLEEEMLNVFPRGAINVELDKQPGVAIKDVSIFDLINAFNEALKRVEQEQIREIFTERYTVAEKIDELIIRTRTNPRICVSALFEGMRSRAEIICTFLAVLELIKLSQITILPQDEAFDEITINRVDDAPQMRRFASDFDGPTDESADESDTEPDDTEPTPDDEAE